MVFTLEIEVGHYINVPPEPWFCKVCNSDRVDDIYHGLLFCASLQKECAVFYLKHIKDMGSFMLLLDNEKIKFHPMKYKIRV